MKKYIVIALILVLPIISLAEGIEFEHITLNEAVVKAKKEGKGIFIDIFATWCGPCKYLTRDVFPDKDLGEYMNQNFINIKLDGEKDEGGALMRKYELNSYPTMLFLNEEGEYMDKLVGAAAAESILSFAKGVANPESTEIFKLRKRYKEGERGRQFLGEYISAELIDENIEKGEDLSQEFIQLFSDLNLEDENEFLIFCVGETDLKSEFFTSFLNDIEHYNSLHPEYTSFKIQFSISNLVEKAIENNDNSIISEGVNILFDPVQSIYEEDITKEELIEYLLKMTVDEDLD